MQEQFTDLHEGHRTRLRQRAQDEGISAFAPHEVLELLLFFGVSRRDVNELAHALIERFGDIAGVSRASVYELEDVSGMGRRAAEVVYAFFRAVRAYGELPWGAGAVIRTRGQGIRFAQQLLEGDVRTQIWLVLVKRNGEVMFTGRMHAGVMWLTEASVRYIVERALRYNAHNVLIVARRMINYHAITDSDMFQIAELARILASIRVYILDYLVLGSTRTVSLRRDVELNPLPYEFGEGLREAWLSEPGDAQELGAGDAFPEEATE